VSVLCAAYFLRIANLIASQRSIKKTNRKAGQIKQKFVQQKALLPQKANEKYEHAHRIRDE
jgi:hypothetical protein